jgi:lipoprotein-anchoring transpeptidase ErfK/SrfK
VNKKVLIGLTALVFVLGVILLALGMSRKGKTGAYLPQQDPSSISSLAAQGKELEGQGKLLEARNLYQQLVSGFSGSKDVMDWQRKIEELNLRLLFSPALTFESLSYEVKSGDTLSKIAKEFKTTPELIMKSNNMSKDLLIPGRKLKVWTKPFAIVVDKSQNLLFLKTGEEVFKTYVVSTGLNNSSPVGNFKIVNKLINPTWFKAGAVVPPESPENILGTRWMGFNLAGFGIHGTTEPQALGQQVTQGCVRMLNAEVEELYTIVPLGTEVTIVD